MSKDIKKALEHCVEWNCADCPNREELGSGEIVCRGRLLPYILEYIADLEAKLEQSQKEKELDNAFWKQECDSLQKALAEKEKAKTDFAIEQLEKIINIFEPYENEEKDTILCANNGVSFLEYVEDKIKELKEKTNVKN